MYEKLKSFIADDAFFTVSLVILVGIVSFGLGRQSVLEKSTINANNQVSGIILTESPPEKSGVAVVGGAETIQVVASRAGTKYHLPSCPGAAQMKEENKLYFASVALAKAAGYTPAANCPGL